MAPEPHPTGPSPPERPSPRKPIALMTVDIVQILLETGRVRPEQLDAVRRHAEEKGSGIEEALTSLDVLSEDEIAAALGRYFEIPGLALARLPKPDPRVTRLVPEAVARQQGVIPLERAGEILILLTADPTDVTTLDAIRKGSGLAIQPVVASPATIRIALDTFYAPASRRALEQAMPFVAKLITEEAARAYQALPVDREGSLLTVAMVTPDEKKKRAFEMATGMEVKPLQASWADIEQAIARVWSSKAPAARTPAADAAPAPAQQTAPRAAPPSPIPSPSPGPKPVETSAPKQAAPVQSLDSLLGGGLSSETRAAPAAQATPPTSAAAGSLGLDLGDQPKPVAAATVKPAAPGAGTLGLDLGDQPKPVAAATVKPAASGAGTLALDIGGGAAATPAARTPAAPPPAAPPRPAATSAKPGSGSLSLDALLGDAAPAAGAPASKRGNGSSARSELEALASGGGEARTAAEAAPDAAPVETEEDDGFRSPNLAAAGGPDGPRTGLKVEATDIDHARLLASQTWGSLDRKLAKLVPERVARNYRVVVTGRLDKKLFVAMEDPRDSFAKETIEFVSGLQVEVSGSAPAAIAAGLEVLYSKDLDELQAIMDELAGVGLDDVEMREELDALSDMDAAEAAEAAPIVKLVTLVIDKALQARASDIHFEVYEEELRIRFRVDGVLREVMRPPLALRDPVISRLKILGRMDISERRLPQDGRLRLRKGRGAEAKDIDFRVSSVPTIHGEKVVMRILDRDRVKLDLLALGMESEPLMHFREAIHRPYGMVLVVGPSGCGKTNTLYSALSDVNRPDVNIMTCEDPVEFSTMGLNQVQARESIGLNFAAALRSFLRQDPNIILVGEVRDFETAEIAVKAALTGHMVLSTLHTNDAPACLNRLTNMGVEPFLIATSLHLVVAQRLVRVICEHCKAVDPVTEMDQLVQMGFTPEQARDVHPVKGTGCERCEDTGYYGRTGLFEVMRITDEMREMILYNGSQMEIRQLGLRQGMRTLRMAGLNKVRDGITSCDEVVRETIG